VSALLPVATTFVGIAFGAYLNSRIARGAREGERAYQQERALKERELEAAATLHADLVVAFRDLPNRTRRADKMLQKVETVSASLVEAGRRAAVLTDPEVERRLGTLNAALNALGELAADQIGTEPPDEDGNKGSPLVSGSSLGTAADELLAAVIAFQRDETPAPAIFPTAEEVNEMSWNDDAPDGGESVGLNEVNRVVRKRRSDHMSVPP
jgi:hypothetical protein